MTKETGKRSSRTSREATCKKEKETTDEKETYIGKGNGKVQRTQKTEMEKRSPTEVILISQFQVLTTHIRPLSCLSLLYSQGRGGDNPTSAA